MLAIAVAFEREIRDYLNGGDFRVAEKHGPFRFYLSPVIRDVVVVEGGFGPQLSRDAAQLVIEKYQPHLLLSAGYAAAARPDMAPGEVYVCQRLLSLTGEAAFWGADTLDEKVVQESVLPYDDWNDIDIQWATCLTLPTLVSGSSMKEWIGKTFATDLIDMESYGVSEVADQHGIPALILRAVFDPMEQTLPPFVARSLNATVQRTAVRAALYCMSHPGAIKATVGLKEQANQATASLSNFLLNLAPYRAKDVPVMAGAR